MNKFGDMFSVLQIDFLPKFAFIYEYIYFFLIKKYTELFRKSANFLQIFRMSPAHSDLQTEERFQLDCHIQVTYRVTSYTWPCFSVPRKKWLVQCRLLYTKIGQVTSYKAMFNWSPCINKYITMNSSISKCNYAFC